MVSSGLYVCMYMCVLCNFLGLCTAPVGSEGRRRSREEEEEEALKKKQLNEEQLIKVSEITSTLQLVSLAAICLRWKPDLHALYPQVCVIDWCLSVYLL